MSTRVRTYPHPGLVVPTTFKGRGDAAAYSKTISSRSAFDAADVEERELLEEAGVIAEFDSEHVCDTRYASSAEVRSDSPSFFYRFSESLETNGMAIPDWSGNNRNATLTVLSLANYTSQAGGPFDYEDPALRIQDVAAPSAGCRVVLQTYGTTAFAATGNCSLSVWVKRNADNGTVANIFGGTGANSPRMWNSTGGSITDVFFRPSETGVTFSFPNALPFISTWTHLALRYVNSTDTATLYSNGVEVATDVEAGSEWGATTDGAFRIGHWHNGASESGSWNGSIKDFAWRTGVAGTADRPPAWAGIIA